MNRPVREMRHPRLLGSLFYLLYYAAGGATYPYMNLFYESAGMTNRQIGVLAALAPVMMMVASPLWSALADKLRLHRVLLPGMMVAVVVPALLFTGAQEFWQMGGLVLLYMFFFAPVIPLADNAVISMLADQRDSYGAVRLWGAVGFGASAWTVGQVTARWGMGVIFYIFSAFMLLTALVALRLPMPRLETSVNYLASMKRLVSNRRWLGFLGAVSLVALGYSMYDNFYALYVKSMGGSEALIGALFLVSTASELPIFFFATWLIRKLTLRGVIAISFVVFMVRAIGYSLIVAPDQALWIQLMHGMTFSALWTAAVIYVSKVAPEGLGASAQAIFGLAFFGVTRIFGALLGSQLYDRDPVVMFRVAAGSILLGLLVFLYSEWRADQRDAQLERVPV
jgi:PPP family 3-phenylpropionic acid transporter